MVSRRLAVVEEAGLLAEEEGRQVAAREARLVAEAEAASLEGFKPSTTPS